VIGPELHIVTISFGVDSAEATQTRPVHRRSRAALARIFFRAQERVSDTAATERRARR
jgi:hypothetical protein